MPEFPDFLPGGPPERSTGGPRRFLPGGVGGDLRHLVDKYEELMRGAEEMREIGNTRMAEDFQRMAERVKNRVKEAQVYALENRRWNMPSRVTAAESVHDVYAGVANPEAAKQSWTLSRLARRPDGSWVEMPEKYPERPPIAGGVGELPVKSIKTPDFIRRLKGDSDLVNWLHRVAGAGAPGGPTEELVDEAIQSAFHIRHNPAENTLIGVAEKYGNKYGPVGPPSKVPAMPPVEGLLFHLRNAEDFSGQVGGGAKYLDDKFPGLRQEKALVGEPGSGRWGFSVGELLDDIAKNGKDSKKALAFASMERFGHPEYVEQIVMVDDYIQSIGSGASDLWEGWDPPERAVQLQEGLSKQLGRPDLHNKVAAAAPHRGGTQAGWMAAAEDSAYQLRQALGGLNPEYVSPTGPTGHRLSPMPHLGAWSTNFNLEMDPANWRTQPQLSPARGQLMPDDIMALANRQVSGGLGGAPDLGAQSTKEFWGGMWDDPRRPQPRSPAIGELMPGPKGGYPVGPPVGRGLTDFVTERGGRLQQGSGPAGWNRPAYMPPPPQEPFGRRVPGGVQLQMQFASGKPIAMNGPILSEFYKMFPGKSIKDAPGLLYDADIGWSASMKNGRIAGGLWKMVTQFGDEAVRLALKLPK